MVHSRNVGANLPRRGVSRRLKEEQGEFSREDPEGEIPRSVAPEQRLRGYTPGNFPLRVLPMAHFHPTFIGSPSLNRLEQRLRGAFFADAIPRRRCSGATHGRKTALGPPRRGSSPSSLHRFAFFQPCWAAPPGWILCLPCFMKDRWVGEMGYLSGAPEPRQLAAAGPRRST